MNEYEQQVVATCAEFHTSTGSGEDALVKALEELLNTLPDLSIEDEQPTALLLGWVGLKGFPRQENTWERLEEGDFMPIQLHRVLSTPPVVNERTLEIWQEQMGQATNPVAIQKFAGSLCAVQETVSGKRPNIDTVRKLCESALLIYSKELGEEYNYRIGCLYRALRFAVTYNQANYRDAITESMIDMQRRLAAEGKTPWGFCWPLMEEYRKWLSEDAQNAVVDLTEAETYRVLNSGFGHPEMFIGHVDGLLRYLHHTAQKDRLAKLLKEISQQSLSWAEPQKGLLAVSVAERILETLEEYGLDSEAAAMLPKLEEFQQRSLSEMKAIEHSVEIPAAQIRSQMVELLSEDFTEALIQIAFQFIPDSHATIEQEIRTRGRSWVSLFSHSTIGADGRTLARSSRDPDDLSWDIMQHALNEIVSGAPFMRIGVEALQIKHGADVESLVQAILDTKIFEENRREQLRGAFTAYVERRVVESIHVMVPLVEYGIRQIAKIAGAKYMGRHNRHGGTNVATLESLFADQSVQTFLGARIIDYYKTVLNDPRGINARNSVAHGLWSDNHFNPITYDRLFHIMLTFICITHSSGGETVAHTT